MIWIIVIVVVVGVLLLRANRTGDTFTIHEVEVALAGKGLLVDVRTPAEYQTAHAVGSKNYPLQTLQAGSSVGGNKDMPIYVYCHSGARAGIAKKILVGQGYKKVVNIGSLRKWKQLGGTVV